MRAGRRNLARVRNQLFGGPLAHMTGGDAAQIIAKVKMLATATLEKAFVVGDQLELGPGRRQQNEAVRKPIDQSEALHGLYGMEWSSCRIQSESAAALAGGR